MKYRYEADLWVDKAYEQTMREQVPFTRDEIRDKTMPIEPMLRKERLNSYFSINFDIKIGIILLGTYK